VRSVHYIIYQYFCSMSNFIYFFFRKNGVQFENQVKQGLTGYTQTYIKFANTSISNLSKSVNYFFEAKHANEWYCLLIMHSFYANHAKNINLKFVSSDTFKTVVHTTRQEANKNSKASFHFIFLYHPSVPHTLILWCTSNSTVSHSLNNKLTSHWTYLCS